MSKHYTYRRATRSPRPRSRRAIAYGTGNPEVLKMQARQLARLMVNNANYEAATTNVEPIEIIPTEE